VSERIEAFQVVEDACIELGMRLADLIALTSFWIHPDVVARAGGPRHPNRRRANLGLRVNGVPTEAVGQVLDGITLDNNTYANTAFKQALGINRRDFVGFHVCHVWPGTANDPQCYTHLANLVGIPADLSSLTDHHAQIVACLKFRSWELYRWRPAAERFPPVMPVNYPARWREPYLRSGATGVDPGDTEPFEENCVVLQPPGLSPTSVLLNGALPPEPTAGPLPPNPHTPPPSSPAVAANVDSMPANERRDVIAKVRLWARKPDTKVYKMIGLVVRSVAALPREQLVRKIEEVTGSKNAYGAVASLLTSRGNAYGRVMIDIGGRIHLHPDVREEILSHSWL
jgi:hypothetical protein